MIVRGQKIKPPCGKSCPRRGAGCHASCPEWAAYVVERDKDYDNRSYPSCIASLIRMISARLS